jgi:hypothetical protein
LQKADDSAGATVLGIKIDPIQRRRRADRPNTRFDAIEPGGIDAIHGTSQKKISFSERFKLLSENRQTRFATR